jgi:hypothetical protein
MEAFLVIFLHETINETISLGLDLPEVIKRTRHDEDAKLEED